MATTINLEAEQAAIITILNDPAQSGRMLGVLSEDWFGDDSAREAFNRVLVRIRAGKTIPRRKEFVIDQAMTEECRLFVSNIQEKPSTNDERTDRLIELLGFHRKLRGIMRSVTEIVAATKLSTEETVHELESKIDQLTIDMKAGGTAPKIVNFGEGDNIFAEEVKQRIMSGDKTARILTGFKYFDERGSGFKKGHAVLIAGPVAGGKSAMANQLLVNMYKNAPHHSVLLVSLEMDAEECMGRMVSSSKRIDFGNIERRTMSVKEAIQFQEGFDEFNAIGKNSGKFFKVWNPDDDVTSANVISYARPLKPDVIVVDYIGLLAQEDSKDEQWKAMGKAMRQFKLAAKKLECAIIVLAQFDQDQAVVKYSRALKEHANIMWCWSYGPQEEATGLVTIRQTAPFGKNRNCQAFDFRVKYELQYMSITDAGAADAGDNKPGMQPKQRSKDKPENIRKIPAPRTQPGIFEPDE